MPDDERSARTTRCPDPSPTVAKQLFGTAVKCGRPDCNETLYRLEDGRPALNCRIAHIKASAPNGPRADPYMTCTEVNSFGNLLLLCPYDSALIDDRWQDFPVEMLADWKRQQVDQVTLLGSARQPTEDEIARLIVESRDADPVARSATVDLARSVRQLRSDAERTRSEPLQILHERAQAERQLNRGFVGFDEETGERSQIRLSRADERRFAERITDALRRSRPPVETAADEVLADAAGVAAATGLDVDGARSWVERAVAEVVLRAGEWNDELSAALDQLDQAAAALTDSAAGRATHVPEPPEPPTPPEPSALELFLDRCREVHELAARHSRVDHLAFDAALHADVLSLAPTCASVPAVLSLTEFGNDRNAALAAAILKNANDEQFAQSVSAAAALVPEAAAAQHLRHLYFLTKENNQADRSAIVQTAIDQLGATVIDRAQDRDFWHRNAEHGSLLVSCAETTVGGEMVTAALADAFEDPTLLEPVLVALSETVENVDNSTMEFLGIRRRFSNPDGPLGGLSSSIPLVALCAAIERNWPAGPSASGPEVERLAAEVRKHYCARNGTNS